MTSKLVGIKLQKTGSVRLETPGGGGYGSPFDRDPEAVANDLRLGYISMDSARESYGVVVAKDGSVDAAATTNLRRERATAN
jgi:N-methylhydantoinase B